MTARGDGRSDARSTGPGVARTLALGARTLAFGAAAIGVPFGMGRYGVPPQTCAGKNRARQFTIAR